MVSVARADLDALWYRSKRWLHPTHVGHPFRRTGHVSFDKPRADGGDSSVARLPGDCCGLAIEPTVTRSVGLEYFRLAVLGDVVLLDAASQQIDQWSWLTLRLQ